MMFSRYVNEHGDVDMRCRDVAKAVVVLPGRMAATARALGVEYARAFVGFKRVGGRYVPVRRGIAVLRQDAQRVRDAYARRSKTRERARERRQRSDVADFAREIVARFPSIPRDVAEEIASHAAEIGSGRVGRCRDHEDAARLAVIAHVRHAMTDYEELLETMTRAEARAAVAGDVREVLEMWERRTA